MAHEKEHLEEYPLTQDYLDFNRLNLQHYLWKDIFGYNLHPKIPREGPGLKIADVGTGTGIWLQDLSSELDPSTEFLGLDNDITQAGPEKWLPPNMRLRLWDATSSVPGDLVEKFDIVNLRLFGFIIRDDPTPVLRNLIRLLKPGGYIQWCEADVESWRIQTISPDVPTESLDALWKQSVPTGSRMLPSWIKSLSRTFEIEGLIDVEADWQEGKPHTTLAMHWCNLNLYQMIAHKLRRSNPEKANEIEGLLGRGLAQSRQGATYVFKRVNVIGRKLVTVISAKGTV